MAVDGGPTFCLVLIAGISIMQTHGSRVHPQSSGFFLGHFAGPIGTVLSFINGLKAQTLMDTTLLGRCFHTMKWPLSSAAHPDDRSVARLIDRWCSPAGGCER